jgi:hypothetical protein
MPGRVGGTPTRYRPINTWVLPSAAPSTTGNGASGPGEFIAPHGVAVDSRGDIYVAEVSNTYWPQLFGKKPDHELRSLQKLARVS